MKRINVTKSSLPSFFSYMKLIKTVWKSNQLTNFGPLHSKLEHTLKEYLSVDNIYLVANGHLALELAIELLQLEGEVITTPFTFVSTTNSIIRSGLRPVFCDINRDNFTIDVNMIESLITENTSAILAVHVYGNICDIDEIARIASKYKLKVLYDAAHSFGITYNGKSIMSYGDISITSFHAAKLYNTAEGGAIFINNPNFSNVNELINFGISKNGDIVYPGLNAKMNEFNAALGLLNLGHVDREIEMRKKVAMTYDKLLSNINGISFPEFQNMTNYSYYVILIDNHILSRDGLLDYLKTNNVMARKYFWPLTSNTCFSESININQLKVAEFVSKSVIALPMYGKLKTNEIKHICRIIKKYANEET
jgi:dTDP-4-amino-4,6-dideoxygalactose transaminase